jgi:putative ABC transport system substrate-binding protein
MPFRSLGQGKLYRIAFLAPDSQKADADPFLQAMIDGLREKGYVVGKNLQLDISYASGRYERMPELAVALVESKPDLLMSVGTPGVLALKSATRTIPIVMVSSGDALATGLVASLASSGNNVTGATFFGKELMQKRLQILSDVVPGMQRMAVLVNPANQTTESNMRAMNESAKALKMELVAFDVHRAEDISAAFEGMRTAKVQALVTFEEAILYANAKTIADLALKRRLPSGAFPDYADLGGLLGYGANFAAMFRRAGYFVDKVLKGEPPSRIPIERPTTFDLVINLKTARALNLRLSQSVMGGATRVIE